MGRQRWNFASFPFIHTARINTAASQEKTDFHPHTHTHTHTLHANGPPWSLSLPLRAPESSVDRDTLARSLRPPPCETRPPLRACFATRFINRRPCYRGKRHWAPAFFAPVSFNVPFNAVLPILSNRSCNFSPLATTRAKFLLYLSSRFEILLEDFL